MESRRLLNVGAEATAKSFWRLRGAGARGSGTENLCWGLLGMVGGGGPTSGHQAQPARSERSTPMQHNFEQAPLLSREAPRAQEQQCDFKLANGVTVGNRGREVNNQGGVKCETTWSRWRFRTGPNFYHIVWR